MHVLAGRGQVGRDGEVVGPQVLDLDVTEEPPLDATDLRTPRTGDTEGRTVPGHGAVGEVFRIRRTEEGEVLLRRLIMAKEERSPIPSLQQTPSQPRRIPDEDRALRGDKVEVPLFEEEHFVGSLESPVRSEEGCPPVFESQPDCGHGAADSETVGFQIDRRWTSVTRCLSLDLVSPSPAKKSGLARSGRVRQQATKRNNVMWLRRGQG